MGSPIRVTESPRIKALLEAVLAARTDASDAQQIAKNAEETAGAAKKSADASGDRVDALGRELSVALALLFRTVAGRWSERRAARRRIREMLGEQEEE